MAAHLPAERAAEILRAVAPDAAAGALSVSHPRLGVRLLHAFPKSVAAAVIERMHTDDATTLLRALPPADLDRLLAEVPTERAATLRRLLSHRVDTAGGLMNPTVRTAGVGEPIEVIRDRAAGEPARRPARLPAAVGAAALDGRADRVPRPRRPHGHRHRARPRGADP